MLNQRGSILLTTLAMSVVLCTLGLASIQFATMQNKITEKRISSSGAYWLADAAIERARAKLPTTMNNPNDKSYNNVALNKGIYTVSSVADTIKDKNGNVTYTYKHRWIINSLATLKGEKRGVRAVAGRAIIEDILSSRGPIKNLDKCPSGSIDIDCTKVKQSEDFTFESVFPGLTYQTLYNDSSLLFKDSKKNEIRQVEGVIIVSVQDSKYQIPKSFIKNSGFVIIDCNSVSSCDVSIEGGEFTGILWIKGKTKISGNPTFNGSIFIEGDPKDQTDIGGSGKFYFDEEAIDEATGLLDDELTGSPSIVSWEELGGL